MITEDERFIEIQGILAFSDVLPENCTKINDLIIELSKENEMLHHYKTLYQSLKKQKEELKEWLEESKKISLAQYHVIAKSICNIVMSKIEELEKADSDVKN